MMDAASRVHRFHAAKVEGRAAHSAQLSARSAGQNASKSAMASAQASTADSIN